MFRLAAPLGGRAQVLFPHGTHSSYKKFASRRPRAPLFIPKIVEMHRRMARGNTTKQITFDVIS
jgi:hypothetical protein